MIDYLRLLPPLVELVAVFGLVFAVFAYVALRLRGATGVWIAWCVFVPSMTAGCVIALSGLRQDIATFSRVAYYTAVAFAAIGVPLAVSARAMTALARRTPPLKPPLHVLAAWAAGVATSPIAVLLIWLIDRLAA